MRKTPNHPEMYDVDKSIKHDDTHVGGKSELGSLQRDEKTEKAGDRMGEHLNAKLEDGEFGRHGMKAHMHHAVKHLHKESHGHHEMHKHREEKNKY